MSMTMPREDTGPGAPVISMRDAAFGYGEDRILDHLTLDIRRGEVVAVLGPNGSGKSTLVRGLLGLTDHLGGEVRLLGVPLAEFRERERIGYVPQRHTLASSVRATVAEIVVIGRLRFHRWWRPWDRRADADRQVVARVLDVVGLGDRAASDVTQLSGGQQRRVLIARALASQPDLLLMDEPTAGVDLANQQVLAEVIARLAAEGATMVIVTHELAALAGQVTRVVVIADGSVRFDGPASAFAGSQADAFDHVHHDDEDSDAPHPRRPMPAGPLDTTGGRHA